MNKPIPPITSSARRANDQMGILRFVSRVRRWTDESSDRLKRLRSRLSLSFDATSNFNTATVSPTLAALASSGQRCKRYTCVRRSELSYFKPHLITCTLGSSSDDHQPKLFKDLSHKGFCEQFRNCKLRGTSCYLNDAWLHM